MITHMTRGVWWMTLVSLPVVMCSCAGTDAGKAPASDNHAKDDSALHAATFEIATADTPASSFEIRKASLDEVDGWDRMEVHQDPQSRVRWVSDETILSGKDIASSRVVDYKGRRGVRVELNVKGFERFSQYAVDNTGHAVAVIVDGKLINTPVLDGPVGPVFVVTGVAEEGLDATTAEAVASVPATH